MRSSIVSILVIVLSAHTARGAASADADGLSAEWQRYQRGPMPEAGYVASLDDGLRETLQSNAKARSSIAAAVADVSKRFEISRDTAADIVEATLIRRSLPEPYSDGTPDPSRVDKMVSALWRGYRRQPAAAIVVQQAAWILLDAHAGDERLLEALRRSSDPGPLAARVAWTGLCSEETRRAVIALALERRPSHPGLLLEAAALEERDPCVSAAWARSAVDAAVASHVTDPVFLAAARNRLLSALLAAGLQRNAVDAFADIPRGETEAVMTGRGRDGASVVMGLEYQARFVPVRAALGAAAFLVGEREVALRVATPARPNSRPGDSRDYDAEAVALVHTAITSASNPWASDAFDTLERAIVASDSWTGYRFISPTLLFARHAIASGYPEIAADLAAREGLAREEGLPAPDRLKARVEACRAERARLEDELAQLNRREPHGNAAGTGNRPPTSYAERTLPGNVVSCDPSSSDSSQERETWGLKEMWPVRVEQNGKSVIAIGVSQDYDPAGELSGGGYWVVRSRDAGKTWGRAMYTGLRPMQPYVICSSSQLPLAVGERLQIEVAIRELDDSEIMFPPLSRSFKRERTGLYLDVAWADLERDSDADGLTDLAEDRLGIAPLEADTDGDGLPDGADPLPQVALEERRSAEAAVLSEVLRQATGASLKPILAGDPGGLGPASPDALDITGSQDGHEFLTSDATMFIVGDRRPFAGLSLDRRVIVLSPSEASAAVERFGVHFPVTLRLYVDHAGRRALAIWDESWRGMTLRLRKKGDRWVCDIVTSWIT